MKKLLLLVTLAMTLMANAQTITIGDDTSISNQVPFNTLYNYAFAEHIFHADEIEYAGTIKAIRFRIAYSYSSPSDCSIDVYMKHVSNSTFSSPSDYEPVTADDKVYSGPWTIPADTDDWIPIVFDTPFAYNGTDNLLIAIDENSDDFGIRYFKYSEAEGTVLSYYSDDQNPDPCDLSSFTGFKELSNQRPNIKLVFGANVGLAEQSTNTLSAHPVPAQDLLYIEGAEKEMVKVYDATGRLVLQEIYKGELNIGNLESGLYAVSTSKGVVKMIKR